MAAPPKSPKDGMQVLQHAFDDASGRLRVDADFELQTVQAQVELAADEDSVRVEDPDTGAHIRVEADGSINVNTEVDAADGDNIAISDGTDTLEVNPDGSINVVPTIGFVGTPVHTFGEVSSVATSTLTNIVSRVAGANGYLKSVSVAGTNIAQYEILINGSVIDRQYTYFGNSLDGFFNFNDGYSITSGDTILVRVLHQRPNVGDFNARIYTLE